MAIYRIKIERSDGTREDRVLAASTLPEAEMEAEAILEAYPRSRAAQTGELFRDNYNADQEWLATYRRTQQP